MWSEGTIGIPDAADKNKYTACHYWVKHYDEPSEIYKDLNQLQKGIDEANPQESDLDV